MAKNIGEIDEVLVKLRLIELRDSGGSIKIDGQQVTVNNVSLKREFDSIPVGVDIQKLSKREADILATRLGAGKAGLYDKADVKINGIGYSIKSHRCAPAAIINHTPRWGWLRICKKLGVDIAPLDAMVAEYTKLRTKGQIGEDIYNNDPNSPFAANKEYLRPLVNYFIFDGVGSKDSDNPASYVLSVDDPFDENKWFVTSKDDYFDKYWDDMKFSLRKHSINYPFTRQEDLYKNAESEPWVAYFDGKMKLQLHLRVR